MRFGTKILLVMLLLTVGISAMLTWVVTLNFTQLEKARADERTSRAIEGYSSHLRDRHRQVDRIVRALLEAPAARSQLQALDEGADPAAREQLRQEIFGRNVQTELASADGAPAFHVLLNHADEVLVAGAGGDKTLETALASPSIRWPINPLLDGAGLASLYFTTSNALFLAMGVPLRMQLDEPPSHAYFVGFRVDDEWIRRQLNYDRASLSGSDAPLLAWFVVGDKVVACASSSPHEEKTLESAGETPPLPRSTRTTTAPAGSAEPIQFEFAGERYVGRSFDLNAADPSSGRLILASSLDRALLPLRSVQRQIILCSIAACLIAAVACRIISRRLVRPIETLVAGTQRIAAGQFDRPVPVERRDELGQLAGAFNDMAAGLKERDTLRDEKGKIERDLALAREIQMGVLPRDIPTCPGYDIAAYSLPAEQTGGDIYDLVSFAQNEIAETRSLVILLADATGHGIGPAISVTQVRSMLRLGVRLRASLDDTLWQINAQLCQDLSDHRFVTAFLGLLDTQAHVVHYHSAGQGPLLHFVAAGKRMVWLDATMLPLGVDEDPRSDGVQQIALAPGDLLVLLTDGFYEFHNLHGQQFGADRVADVVRAHNCTSSAALLNEILAATLAFGDGAAQADDMTALIIRRLET